MSPCLNVHEVSECIYAEENTSDSADNGMGNSQYLLHLAFVYVVVVNFRLAGIYGMD